jgi:hypothetical protein
MKTPVSKSTITHLTRTEVARGAHPQPPAVADLLTAARQNLTDTLANIKTELLDNKVLAPESREALSAKQIELEAKLKRFDQLVESPPTGFGFAAVLYDRVETEQAHKVRREFNDRARAGFLKFLAQKHEPALKALGFGEEQVARMKEGYDPITENGELYEISVDHIIEKSGSGKLAFKRIIDPLHLAPETQQKGTFRSNHYNNLILLPDAIHRTKNFLNDVQGVNKISHGQKRWVVMLVPVRDEHHLGYVAPPDQNYPLKVRPFELDRAVGLTNYKLRKVADVYELLEHDRFFKDILDMCEYTASRLEARGAFNASAHAEAYKKLEPIARALIGADDNLKALYEGRVAPLLIELADSMEFTYKKLSEPNVNPRYLNEFKEFFNGQRLQRLLGKLKDIPLLEAQKLLAVCDSVSFALSDAPRAKAKLKRAV